MGQKIHPLGFRLGITQKHQSQWFAKHNQYSNLVIEDHFLRKIVLNRFSDAGISEIKIQRKLDQILIEICSARPRSIIGRDRNGLEILRKELEQELKKYRIQNLSINSYLKLYKTEVEKTEQLVQISIHVTKLANQNAEASFIADFLVEQLEKRVAFRRAVKRAIERAQKARIKGIKIQISGRLNGAEIARTEWVRKGQVPLQTLRADIDYSYQTAKTIYGLLGIKVWVFKGFSTKNFF